MTRAGATIFASRWLLVAALLCAVFVANSQAQAPGGKRRPAPPAGASPVSSATTPMQIWQFDRMADDDQINYVTALVDSVEEAVPETERARVKRFFMEKQPGEAISGMGQFELNLAYVRIADLEIFNINPKAPRGRVDDVMRMTLAKNGIVLPKNARIGSQDFQPKLALHPAMSKQQAVNALLEVRKWTARKTGPVAPAELENPQDALWVDRLDFNEPGIVAALFTGDFSHVRRLRTQVLTYITAINEYLGPLCPKLYDSSVSSRATAQTGAGLPTGNVGGLPSGDVSDLRMQLERGQMDTDSGTTDAQILLDHAPEKCESVIITQIYRNMETYVQPL